MSTPPAAASTLVGAARVGLGGLWLMEGILKLQAHFSGADIALVVQSATGNPRVPFYFRAFATSVMQPLSGFFGFAIPLLETGLGVALVLGVLTRAAAAMSALTLLLYWSGDQLITQYPFMLALSVVVVAWPRPAARFSLTALVARLLRRRKPASRPLPARLAGWL